MTQVEQFKGRLGFKTRSNRLLNKGLIQAVDMLEEYGHPMAQINTRAANRVEMEGDQYRVILRLRRLPLRLGMHVPAGLSAPAIFLEVTMERLYPSGSDSEITEILLAVLLRRLAETLSPTVVFWQDAPKAMTCDAFLGVFNLHHAGDMADTAEAQATAERTPGSLLSRPASDNIHPRSALPRRRSARTALPTPSPFKPTGKSRTSAKLFAARSGANPAPVAEKPRGRSCFAPVEAMADDLDQQCARHVRTDPAHADQVVDLSGLKPAQGGARAQGIVTWAATGLVAMLSAPAALLLLLVELLRGSQLTPRRQALSLGVFLALLQSTEMVQAAAKVLKLPTP
ncbi:hypothetical protein [Phaeobacter gallaeciensis]|uniref:hypothetical protein n=1 Tax=Phaeobacter gallaeciensis TaxID=60890 RepID=UPI00237F26C7|nr:hypothetical protein [Phaeobacter gallaeciensis]MDE4192463.1 hypothetical protein [Phaeobacter gallaeciensis]MDE4201070.1 hypothetical protein [Phaeobacter gallaeciensis]MDE4205223.1 hypothetical protein [Phaeobacter gallaeciensis]MDE4209362.1 hypothetical protein [Phaeobacter gallaeciensis]MDE4217586.1 hypothetical protein [Phaeobacter gallaeciensis]